MTERMLNHQCVGEILLCENRVLTCHQGMYADYPDQREITTLVCQNNMLKIREGSPAKTGNESMFSGDIAVQSPRSIHPDVPVPPGQTNQPHHSPKSL